MRVKLPASLKAIYGEEENSEGGAPQEVGVASTPNEEEIGEPEVEMNWNVCTYLPESGSCQDIFRVIVAGHIHALYSHEAEGRRNHAPGSTPIQRRANITQSQVCIHVESLPDIHIDSIPPPSLSLSLTHTHTHTHTYTHAQFTPDNTVTPSLVSFAQERIQKELTDKLFRCVRQMLVIKNSAYFSCNGSSVGSRLPCVLAVMVAQLVADCRVL